MTEPDDPYRPLFGFPITPWHRWFAWHPVDTADRGWRWLRIVWRRRCQKKPMLDGPGMRWFQYAVEVRNDRH